jgi:hypothetical protein
MHNRPCTMGRLGTPGCSLCRDYSQGCQHDDGLVVKREMGKAFAWLCSTYGLYVGPEQIRGALRGFGGLSQATSSMDLTSKATGKDRIAKQQRPLLVQYAVEQAMQRGFELLDTLTVPQSAQQEQVGSRTMIGGNALIQKSVPDTTQRADYKAMYECIAESRSQDLLACNNAALVHRVVCTKS